MLEDKLRNIISEEKGERGIARFIKEHPEVLRWAICKTGGHTNYILKEFPLSSMHRPDFVVLTSYSGVWEVHFIEFEPHEDKIITKKGTPSQTLNSAIKQISDWRSFVQENPMIRTDLAKWCQKKDILEAEKPGQKPTNYSNDYLGDIQSFIRYQYHIFIGQRENVTNDIRRSMNQLASNFNISICTYGRLLDVSKNIDDVERRGVTGIWVTRSDE